MKGGLVLDCFRSSALSVSPILNVIFARSQLSLLLEHPPRFNPPAYLRERTLSLLRLLTLRTTRMPPVRKFSIWGANGRGWNDMTKAGDRDLLLESQNTLMIYIFFNSFFFPTSPGEQRHVGGWSYDFLWPLTSLRRKENHFRGKRSCKLQWANSASATSAGNKTFAQGKGREGCLCCFASSNSRKSVWLSKVLLHSARKVPFKVNIWQV